MSIMDDVRLIVDMQPKSTEGYIIAFAPTSYADRILPQYRALFAKSTVRPKSRNEITGGGLEDARIFSTYQEASEAALGWHHTRDNPCRIIRVKSGPPLAIFDDYSITLIETLGEL